MVPDEDEPDSPPDITPTPDTDDWPDGADDQSGHIKYYVHGVPVEVVSERVEYYSVSGDLVTESLKDYTRKNIRGDTTLSTISSLCGTLRTASRSSSTSSKSAVCSSTRSGRNRGKTR